MQPISLIGNKESMAAPPKIPAPIALTASPKAPETPRVDIRDIFCEATPSGERSVVVRDPYRWLERPYCLEQEVIGDQRVKIAQWEKQQSRHFAEVMRPYADDVAYVRHYIYGMLDHPAINPRQFVPGLGFVQWRRASARSPWKLHLEPAGTATSAAPGDSPRSSSRAETEVLLDTDLLAKQLGLHDSLKIHGPAFSPNGKYAALMLHEYGSDWAQIAVMDVAARKIVSDRLTSVSGNFPAADPPLWIDDYRFVYCGINLTQDERNANAPNRGYRLRLHEVGSAQNADIMLFSEAMHDFQYPSLSLEKDGRMALRQIADERSFITRYEVAGYSADKLINNTLDFHTLAVGRTDCLQPQGFLGDTDEYVFLSSADRDGNPTFGSLVAVDSSKPGSAGRDLVPEVPGQELESTLITKHHIVGTYESDLTNHLVIYCHDGRVVRSVYPEAYGLDPGRINVMGLNEEKWTLAFELECLLKPQATYCLDLTRDTVKLVEQRPLPFNASQLQAERVEVRSKDGTIVPVFIVRKKNDGPAGPRPIILYGYGGFRLDLADSTMINKLIADKGFAPFLEAGGALAIPALRGGGEFGEPWHRQGMRDTKQNVFDDFIAAAERLVSMGCTTREKLAIMGGSNGGLLVGAVLVQRPDLFAVAALHAGPQDLLRYMPKFDDGVWREPEYGDPEDPKEFTRIYQISPYHNVRHQSYPATLVTQGLHDSRVAPSESFKFAAALQHAQTGEAPVCLYTLSETGHWYDERPPVLAEQLGAIIGFVMAHVGMHPPPQAIPKWMDDKPIMVDYTKTKSAGGPDKYRIR
jgi:prolyl oligopeptidase